MRRLALLLCLAPSALFAWSGDGHMQVADIAWTKLTPAVQAKLAKILAAGEPTFTPVNGDVREAFRKSATWSDFIKGTKPSVYDEMIKANNRRFEPNIESTPGNEGVKCKTWHYYDIPIRYRGAEPQVRPSNALVALGFSINELGRLNKLPDAEPRTQAFWVYWINHVVGDLHQPLHCTSSHEHEAEGDDGGNKFMITAPDNDRSIRLHGFWDGAVGKAIAKDREAGLNANVEAVTQRWTSDPTLQPTAAQIKNLDIMSWLKTGAALADKFSYDGLKPEDKPSAEYMDAMITLSKKQVVLSGYRLAEILNKSLG
jgi:hypothetical protein